MTRFLRALGINCRRWHQPRTPPTRRLPREVGSIGVRPVDPESWMWACALCLALAEASGIHACHGPLFPPRPVSSAISGTAIQGFFRPGVEHRSRGRSACPRLWPGPFPSPLVLLGERVCRHLWLPQAFPGTWPRPPHHTSHAPHRPGWSNGSFMNK